MVKLHIFSQAFFFNVLKQVYMQERVNPLRNDKILGLDQIESISRQQI